LIDGEASALEEAKQLANNEIRSMEEAERKRIAEEKAAKERKAQERKEAKQKEAQKAKQSKNNNASSSTKSSTNSKSSSRSNSSTSSNSSPSTSSKPAISRGFIKPTAGGVSSEFNPSRTHPITGKVRPHNGIDIGAPQGTPVYASASGVVSTASVMNGYGNT